MKAPNDIWSESQGARSLVCLWRFPHFGTLSLGFLGLSLLAATPAADAQTVLPQQTSLGFSTAAIGTTTPQTLVADFAVSGYSSGFTPVATTHYRHDYKVSAANCSSTGSGTETCSFSVTFTPTLPGMRKDAIVVGDGSSTLATLSVYGMGQGPLAVFQPGVSIQVTAPVDLYDAAVDENGTAYLLGNNSGQVFSYTKAGVLTQLPVTGLSSPQQIAIDGAGTLYFAQQTYGTKIVTYSAEGVQGAITVQPPAPYVPCGNAISNGNTLEFLSSIAVNGAGDIFVIEDLCSVIFELRADGTYATFPISPTITQPAKLAVDDAGNVFIGGFTIDELTSGGAQTEINTRDGMASTIGNTGGLAVDASGLLYTTPYPGTINGARFGVAELPSSDYGAAELNLDPGAALNGIGLGSDGKFFGGGYFSFTMIDRSQGYLAFGQQTIGVDSAAQIIQLVNIGNQPLDITSVGLAGDPGYAIQASGGMDCGIGITVAPGAYCQVAVVFTPTHSGDSTGTLVISDNLQGGAGAMQAASLNGYVNGAYVMASPSPLNFAPQVIKTASPAQVVLLTNLAVTGTATIGPPSSDNSAFVPSLNTCTAGIVPGASCQILVTFTPTALGTTSGTISASVTGGDPGEKVSFGVSGMGIAPPAILNISETIHTGDALSQLLKSLGLAVTETIHIHDVSVVTPPLSIAVAETIHILDSGLQRPPQIISFPDPGKRIYGEPPIPLKAVASSGFPVTYTVTSGPASVKGSVLTVKGAGAVVVTANQAGDIFHDPASPVSVTILVEKAALTVTARSGKGIYGEKVKDYGYILSGFVNGDTEADAVTGKPSLTTKATFKSSVGKYPIEAGTGTLSAKNYSFRFVAGTLTIAKAPLTVIAKNASRPFGTPNPEFGYTFKGFVSGDTEASAVRGKPSLTTTATERSPVGPYPIVTKAGTLASRDYEFSFKNGTLTITPK